MKVESFQLKDLKPLRVRRAKADMQMKQLSLRQVAKLAGMNYSTVSQVLNGRLNSPARLAKIERVIERCAMPEESPIYFQAIVGKNGSKPIPPAFHK